jgi:hypothetical protein
MVADATTGRNWATREEGREALEAHYETLGKQLYANLVEDVWTVYEILRKRASQGHRTISVRQIARDFYVDVGEDYEAYRRKQKSIQRWLRLLEAVGFIAVQEHVGSSGKTLGLRVELRPVCEVEALTRGCSSVG